MRDTTPGNKGRRDNYYEIQLANEYSESIYVLQLNLQEAFPTAQRSKEQFCWEANLSTHSA